MTRALPTLAALLLTAVPAIAHAAIDVQLSAGVTAASGGAAGRIEPELEAATNAAIDRMASASAASPERDAARRLRGVNQTLRVMCREEAATDPALADLVAQSEVSPGGAGGAATLGAFDQAGAPIEGGTIVMVIECARLREFGWRRGFGVGEGDSMLRVFGHELLHASGRGFRHGDDNLEDEPLYDRFADSFRRTYEAVLEQVQRDLRAAERERRRREQKAARKGQYKGQYKGQHKGKHKADKPPACPPEPQ